VIKRTLSVMVLLAAVSSSSACGTRDASVPGLVTSLRAAGIDCPVLTEAEPRSSELAHSGSCWSRDNEALFDVDVYRSAGDRDKDMASPDGGAPYCVAYGETWTITVHGDPNDPACEAVADRLDGHVQRSGAGITP